MDPGLYGPDSVTWKLTRERVLLLGGGRALLLQLAHPLVAAGVAEHSSFPDDAIHRLTRTLESTLGIVFGTTDEAQRAADRIDRAHGVVRGTLPESSGRYEAGTPYEARDPELLLWVHATLIDTTLEVYPRFVGPVPDEIAERYWEESKTAARILGVPDDLLPKSLADFRAYMDEMLASDTIAAAPFQRELGRHVLSPTIPFVPKPMFVPAAAITVALLPERVRREFGFPLTAGRQQTLDWSAKSSRAILPLMPRRLRWMPQARRAYARVCG